MGLAYDLFNKIFGRNTYIEEAEAKRLQASNKRKPSFNCVYYLPVNPGYKQPVLHYDECNCNAKL